MEGNSTAPAPDAGRRTFVSWLLGGGVAASLASFFYPVVRFLDPPSVAEASVNEVAAAYTYEAVLSRGAFVEPRHVGGVVVRIERLNGKREHPILGSRGNRGRQQQRAGSECNEP